MIMLHGVRLNDDILSDIHNIGDKPDIEVLTRDGRVGALIVYRGDTVSVYSGLPDGSILETTKGVSVLHTPTLPPAARR